MLRRLGRWDDDCGVALTNNDLNDWEPALVGGGTQRESSPTPGNVFGQPVVPDAHPYYARSHRP